MSLSVVIVHYETPELLAGCLASILESAGSLLPEIVVVDNSRREKASQVLAGFPTVRLLENTENTGFSRAVNQGIRASSGEWVLILNPDTRLEAGAVASLIEFGQAHPDAGIVGPRLTNVDGSLQYSCRRFYTLRTLLYRRTFLGRWMKGSAVVREHLMLDYDHASARVVDWVLGGAMLARRRAIEDVGGMDERFFLYFEDVDWCYRMSKRGWKVWYEPAAVVQHHHRRESARDFRGLQRHIVSSLRFWEKWSLVLYAAKQSREGLRGFATVIIDLLAINLAFLVAFVLRGQLAFTLTKPLFPFESYSNFLLLINASVIGALFARGLYRGRFPDWAEHLVELGKALAWAALITMAATYAAYVKSYSRALILLFYPCAVALVFAGRMWVDRGLLRIGERIGARPRALVIGMEPVLGEAAGQAERGAGAWEWCGRVDLDRMGEGLDPKERDRRLQSLLREERIRTLVLACPAQRAAEMTRVADACRPLGLDLYFFTEFTPWLRAGDRLDALGSLPMVRSAPLAPAALNPRLRRITEWVLALLILPFALVGVALGWFSLLLSGRGPRWEGEVWDNGRAERVPVLRLSPTRGNASRLERTGISRGLAVFWILTGRLRLVGAPPRPWGGQGADSESALLPVGITGEWFTDPAHVSSPSEVERSIRRSDLNADLRVLVRSAARIAELLIHSSNSQESQGARS